MEGISVLIIIGLVVFWIIRAVLGGFGGGADARQFQERVNRGLMIRLEDDTVKTDDGEHLPVKAISMSGAMVLPRNNFRSRIITRLTDVSPDLPEPHVVLCGIHELADQDGVFAIDHDLTIPHQYAEVDHLDIGVVPMFALMGPRKGNRQFQIDVFIASASSDNQIYAHGKRVFTFNHEELGYIDRGELMDGHEQRIVELALAVAAADGHIAKDETAAIRSFFLDRYSNAEDASKLKSEINKAYKGTLKRIREGEEKPDHIIDRVSKGFAEDPDPLPAQMAYELCVRVVAADGIVEDDEQAVLDMIQSKLKLDNKYVKEIHDRHIRLSMYKEQEKADSLIDIPEGLTHEEKLAFLNKEYRKWRGRVTHKDPEVAAEASKRLDQVTKMRQQLQEQQND